MYQNETLFFTSTSP